MEVVYTDICAPLHSPAWVYDFVQLTNAIERAERRKDAQLVRSIYVALPKELTREQHIALTKEYAHTFVREEGMIAMLSIHDKGDGNPNAHLLLSMRPLNADGTWAPKATLDYVRDENGTKIKLPSGHCKTKRHNTTTWDYQGNVEKWRRVWATLANHHLKQAGLTIEIDHRSLKRQGKETIPTLRLTRAEWEMDKRGICTTGGDVNRQIRAENQRREETDRKFTRFKQKMQQKRRKRWQSPEREAMQHFWSELRERESHITAIQEGVSLSETLREFKQQVKQVFLDAPPVPCDHHHHHQRAGHERGSHIERGV